MPRSTARRSSAVFEVEPLEVGTVGSRFVQVLLRPYSHASSGAAGAVIEVSDVTATEAARRTAEETERRLERAATVNRHLHDANDEVTALVAQLRLANQAMLQSSEEAQAGREEVETLNEEAQATNEELETLNEELTASVDELRIGQRRAGGSNRRTCTSRPTALEEQRRRRRRGAQPARNPSSRVSATPSSPSIVADRRSPPTRPTTDCSAELMPRFQPEDLAGLPIAARTTGPSSGPPEANGSGWSSP